MSDQTPRMTYPQWMNDALASDLNALIEAREAKARAEYQRGVELVHDYLIRTGYPPYMETS